MSAQDIFLREIEDGSHSVPVGPTSYRLGPFFIEPGEKIIQSYYLEKERDEGKLFVICDTAVGAEASWTDDRTYQIVFTSPFWPTKLKFHAILTYFP